VKILRTDPASSDTPGTPGTPETPATPTKRTVRPLVPPRAPSASKTKNKVLLSVLDGKIEWEKMTAESRKQFEDLFHNPEFLKQFGLTGKEKMLEPEQIKALYDGISTVYQQVCAFFLRWPAGALKLLAYTDEQKQILAGPTANLVNRFAPAFLVQHQEILVWGAVFGAVTQKNFMAASGEAKKLAAQKPAAAIPGAPAGGPVRVPEKRVAPADLPAPAIPGFPIVPPMPDVAIESASLG
jgi:hypothetical protein